MPIEAEVSPLPRELTTPPVTKICRVIGIQIPEGSMQKAASAAQISAAVKSHQIGSASVLKRVETSPQ
jgi:hypothetical protein